MGNYVNNGVVTLVGNVDYDDAVREIATLVGVGRRDDGDKYAGRFVLADVCTSKGINMWALYKPDRGSRNGSPSDVNWGLYVPTFGHQEIWNVADSQRHFKHEAPRGFAYGEYARLKDFNRYNHYASKPVASIVAPTSVYPYTPLYFRIRLSQAERNDDNVPLTYPLHANATLAVLVRNVGEYGALYDVYNTGKSIVSCMNNDVTVTLNPADLEFGNLEWQVGDNLDIVVCAANDRALPTGFTSLSDDYTGTFTLLNLTPALEAERTIPVVERTFVISFDTVVFPTAEQNYFQVGVNSCVMRDRLYSMSEATQTLRFEMYLRRDGVEVEGSVASKDYTFTYTVGEQNGVYVGAYIWANGIQIPPLPVTPETGDKLFFRIIDPKTYMIKWDASIHTY